MNSDIFPPCRLHHLLKMEVYPKDLVRGLFHLHGHSAIVVYVPTRFMDVSEISIYIYNTKETLLYQYNLGKEEFIFTDTDEYSDDVVSYLAGIERAMDLNDLLNHIHFLEYRTLVPQGEIVSLQKFLHFMNGLETYNGVYDDEE